MFDAVLENDLNSESPTGKSVSDSFREIAQRNNIGLVYTKIISFEEMLNLPFCARKMVYPACKQKGKKHGFIPR